MGQGPDDDNASTVIFATPHELTGDVIHLIPYVNNVRNRALHTQAHGRRDHGGGAEDLKRTKRQDAETDVGNDQSMLEASEEAGLESGALRDQDD